MAHIYVLKNKMMPGFCKIGASENVEKRVLWLYGAWEIVKTWEFDMEKARQTELAVKRKMRPFVTHGHELFNCPTKILIRAIESHLSFIAVTPKKKVIPPEAITIRANVSELGKLIRQIRKKQRLTIVEFSGLAPVGYRFMSDLENGKETCQIGKVFAALDALGIKLYAQTPPM